MLRSTLRLLGGGELLGERKFEVMMSSLPSPFTSPKVTNIGTDPVKKSVLALKVPLPLPKRTLALSAEV